MTASPTPQRGPVTTVESHGQSPNLLIRLLWFVFIGWWLSFWVIGLAWLLSVTIVGIPLGVRVFSRVPELATLKMDVQQPPVV